MSAYRVRDFAVRQRASMQEFETTLSSGIVAHESSPQFKKESRARRCVVRGPGGQVLGPAERISVDDAIRASTINAAYQHFEEADKGSIETGKLADFVILSASPFQVEPMAIRHLQIIETIKEGRTIYRRPE